MPSPLLTWHQQYPGGRMVAQLGRIEVGAVFPPVKSSLPWTWQFWLGGLRTTIKYSRTEHAAKNAVMAEVSDWLRAAGLQQETPA